MKRKNASVAILAAAFSALPGPGGAATAAVTERSETLAALRDMAPDGSAEPAAEVDGYPVQTSNAERLKMPGLPNLARVEKGVYRGGRPRLERDGIESLRRLGIKKIINLQGGDLTAPGKARWPEWSKLILKLEPGEAAGAIQAEADAAAAAGIESMNIPLDSLDPITAQEADSLDGILKMLAASGPERPIYVHCEHGKDRTGLALALYRMRYDGWTQARAAAEMAAMGHAGFLDRLFTGNMDLRHVLPRFPGLAAPSETVQP